MTHIEYSTFSGFIILFCIMQSVHSISNTIILKRPSPCETCQQAPLVDFVPFTLEPCSCSSTPSEADTVSLTLALNKNKKSGCNVCLAKEEEKLSFGACRLPIDMPSTFDTRIQEGGLHALNSKVVRLAGTPFSPSYQLSGYFAEKPVCPHLRQCQAQNDDQQTCCL